jgi:hypothetical protein
MNDKYNAGDRVWLYEPGFKPKRAMVVEKFFQHGYKVELKKSRFKIETVIEDYLYRDPEDKARMISDMQQDAYSLLDYIKELEAEE